MPLSSSSAKAKLAIVVSHPIQHFCPQYASFAKQEDFTLRVFFASMAGAAGYVDKNFGRAISWDGLNLSTFDHEFLTEESLEPTSRLDAPSLNHRLSHYAPDAVLVYGYNQPLQRRARRWALSNGSRLLMFSDSELRQRRGLMVRLVKRAFLPHYLRGVDLFLTTGDANEAYYEHYGVPRVRMTRAPYPLDRDAYGAARARARELRSAVRSELGIGDERVLCSVVGKFVPWKRQFDAVAMLAEKGLEQADLLLVGSGAGEAELRALAQRTAPGRVHFAGFVQPKNLPSYYAASDIYLHTSEIEPHSVAVSEAVFMGCPVVISDRCGSWGPTDDVQPERNGLVYRCGNITELGLAIRRLASNQKLRTEYSETSLQIGTRAQALSHVEGIRTAMGMLGLMR